MANHSPFLKATRVHAAVALCIASCASAWAQQNPTEITIIEQLPARVSGFGDVPAQELPFSTTVINQNTLQDIGARRVSDALRLDASVTDSYNSPAYWDILSVRGFTLDNRYNYRREGLPISAETMIPMDNKERIELLKGTSGIQAGTSSPGGLVNYVVKRAPTNAEQQIRNVTLSYGEGNNRSTAADLGGRFGSTGEFGYRFNVAYEDLNPYIGNTKGHRNLVALAMDWRISANTKLEWEFEKGHREQIGISAYSLLGDALPPTVNGTRNITRQTWTAPSVFDSTTGSIRLKQNLENGWLWTTQYGLQQLRTNDRLGYAWGCGAEGRYDRFCSNGTYDLYDFRSDNEKRLTDAIQTSVGGKIDIAGLHHELNFEIMRNRRFDRLPPAQAYNGVGTGSITGLLSTPANPTPGFANTDRTEYSTEISAKDRIHLTSDTSVWLGVRHVKFDRSSSQNSPANSNATQYSSAINLPWLAISQNLSPSTTIYASHGHGVEQFVAPNSGLYANPGVQLGIGRSRQSEAGIRHKITQKMTWNAAVFQIERPLAYDVFDGVTFQSTRLLDGMQKHKGIELGTQYVRHNLTLNTQAQWLQTSINDVQRTSDVVGSEPTNVPKFVIRGLAEYRYASVPGLRTGLRVSHESERNVTENGNIKLPAWTTWGASAHYDTKVNNTATTFSLAIDNLEDKRYWREAPKQFGHYYLYPGAPRTVRATVTFRM
jgi:iron complex outermembrane receptor protein